MRQKLNFQDGVARSPLIPDRILWKALYCTIPVSGMIFKRMYSIRLVLGTDLSTAMSVVEFGKKSSFICLFSAKIFKREISNLFILHYDVIFH